MRMQRTSTYLFCVSLILICVGSALGQTSVAASIYGAFNGSTSGNGVQQSPSNSAGALIEVRHISNPLVGYEGAYSYNRDNQVYRQTLNAPLTVACPVQPTEPCGVETVTTPVSADAHEITGDWIVSLHFSSLRPFALAGGGLLLNVPTSSTATSAIGVCGTINPLCISTTGTAPTTTQTKGVFVYGAGLDWHLVPHLGLRFQYRGNLYKAANLLSATTSTNAFAQSSEPMIGAYFSF
jgi:opacity protein-like surface antigen